MVGLAGHAVLFGRHAEVDRQHVAVMGRTAYFLQRAAVGPQPVDLAVDVVVGGLGTIDRDLKAGVPGDLDDGADLDDGVEPQVALVLTGGDVDLRRAMTSTSCSRTAEA